MLYAAFDGDPSSEANMTKHVLFTDCQDCAYEYPNVLFHPYSPELDDMGIFLDDLTAKFETLFGTVHPEFKRKLGECADAHI